MNLGDTIKPGTLRNTIESSSMSLNLYYVLTLTRYWNISYDEVFSPPDTATNSISPGKLIPNSKPLDNEAYMDTLYHGFMYSRNLKRPGLVYYFELEIKKENQNVIAIMSIKSETDTSGKIRTIKGEDYIGTPLLLESENLLILSLFHRKAETDNQNSGTAKPNYYLYMDYGGHSKGIYYRKGIAITRSTTHTSYNSNQLIMGNFVLFRNRLIQGEERYVRSMLPVMGDTFVISDEAILELAKDEKMKAFFEKYRHNWEKILFLVIWSISEQSLHLRLL